MIICPYCDHETEPPVCGYCKAAVPIVVHNVEDEKVPDKNKSDKEEK